MGPRAWLAAVCVLGSVLAPASGQTRLEWKLKEGDRFFVEVVNTLKRSTSADGKDYKGEMEITTVDGYKVLKTDAAGITLEKTIVDHKFKGTSTTGGDADTELQKMAESMAKKLKGLVLVVSFDPGMQKVAKIDGMKEYVKRVLGDDGFDPTQFENSIKTEQENVFAGFLPDKPVEPGQRWQRKLTHESKEPTTNYTAVLDHTYKGKETLAGKALDRIDVVWNVSFVSPNQTKAELTAEPAKASYYFDSATGRLVKSDRSFHIKGKIMNAGQDKQNVIDQEEAWHIRLTDDNPLAKPER